MKMISTHLLPETAVTRFFTKHWGSPEMVISSGVFRCDELDGFAIVDEENEIIALITYKLEGNECEIISLDSVVEGNGHGTSLLKAVEEIAKKKSCLQIKCITTNDNLHALGFYQKRGYKLTKLLVNAVDEARKIKPDIPLIADNGIPIRDELLLVKNM